MTSGEKPATQNDWPAGSNAFGLYLVIGVFLALAVIVIFGLLERGREDVVKERIKPAVTTTKHSTASGTGAGKRLPEKRAGPESPVRK